MRIIAGRWGGLRLSAPGGDIARPTTDRVKESLFNLLGWTFETGYAIDLFAGSGALGLEALSRGAPGAVFIDKHAVSGKAVRDNIQRCKAGSMCQVWIMDWDKAWTKLATEALVVGWVFVDPPYAQNLWERVLARVGDGAVPILGGVVCEHPRSTMLPENVGKLFRTKHKRYGDIDISVYRPQPPVVQEESV